MIKEVKCGEKGFTLSELLVVIAIMAVLVGVAVGSYRGLIGSGKTESAKYELEAVQTAVDAYMSITASATVTARSTAAVVTGSDSIADYMRRLPTTYQYTWTASGSVTQHGAPGGGGGGGGDDGPDLPTPVAKWRLNEGSGISAADSIGSNDGTIVGGASWSTGKSGNCLSFNTSDDNDYVLMNPFSGFPASEITVEFWMKSSDSSRNGTAISYAVSSNNNEFLLYNYRSFSIYRGGAHVDTGVSANDGSWHHIAITWDGSNGATELYKDGQSVYTGTLASGTAITGGGGFVLGQEQDSVGGGFASNQAFEGEIDEVLIYDQVLSDTEVLASYNSY